MKRIYIYLFFIAIFLESGFASAQIEVQKQKPLIEISEVKTGGLFNSSLNYLLEEGVLDTSYTVFFRDAQYSQITEIESIHHTGKINDLYDLLLNQFKEKDKAQLSVKIGSDDILIITSVMFGVKSIYIFKGRSRFTLTQKQLNKLFKKES